MNKDDKPMDDFPRLIEHAFPLKQASLDSVHEKNVRHGHISTLHIWPARRPLAACRAALIATLLPDPGTPEKRRDLCEKIGGKVVQKIERKKMPNGRTVERVKEETEGGILHWKRENENARDLDWFRKEIRKAYGGRAPRVLDPFAGGGAIPLEAMRLGCDTTAGDINPVAWFILKCTLDYPQRLAGKTLPLPGFILEDEGFMTDFFTRAKGYSKAEAKKAFAKLKKSVGKEQAGQMPITFDNESATADIEADLAWQVRAWGRWVLDKARRELAPFYPTYADFEPLDSKAAKPFEPQPMRLVPLKEDGRPDITALNADFTPDYLKDKGNPRWVAKPTVAYLWARTVPCKNCRATVPLLKTRWLCKKTSKRVLLTMAPNAERTGVVFGVQEDVPLKGGNAAQRRENDKRLGEGTMSKAGARCPCCNTIMTMDDIQFSAKSGAWTDALCAAVVNGPRGKAYRALGKDESLFFEKSRDQVSSLEKNDPLSEPISHIRPSPNARGLSGLTRYGIDTFQKVFNDRQRLALTMFVHWTRRLFDSHLRKYPMDFFQAIFCEIALAIDRVADRNSTLCHWDLGRETISGTFQRYALRVNWDYCEVNPFSSATGNYIDAVEWICRYLDHALEMAFSDLSADVVLGNAKQADQFCSGVDLILTDPPYYDAIPYADLSDFFYVWLRRVLRDTFPEEFSTAVTEKKDELIQHAAKGEGNNELAKKWYEDGMAETFLSASRALNENGRFVIVFAHKYPDAWEVLVSAIVRAGFLVDASWPIQTEMPNKAAGGARLASSVWLVCKKRPVAARPGWDSNVLQEMRSRIATRLHEYWDAGIRGPDFVWAATGPALEAYSKHPVVKKANTPGQVMTVGEFLSHVRRMVVDFVVGQVLTGQGEGADLAAADRMDAPTAYYLLHRHDFGLEDAPAGACILYATACGLSDQGLESTWNLLDRSGGKKKPAARGAADTAEGDVDNLDGENGSGSTVRLQGWARRKQKSMGYEAPGGQPVPLIDRVHRLMHLWRAGEAIHVDEYLDDYGLRRHELFKRLLQSLIELAAPGSEERNLLESLSNHVQAKGAAISEARLRFDAET